MPLHFVCPHCGLETLVEDDYSGRSGPCASCGEPIAVPQFAVFLPADSVQPAASPRKSRSGQVLLIVFAGAVAAGFFVFLLLALAFPGVQTMRVVQQRSTCKRNLQRIGDALLRYHEDHGAFPPAFVADANGKPMHSWRVLILPYLNEEGLYQQYDFNQPWNSTKNSRLAQRMPDVYACDADPEAKACGETNYMVVVGRYTMFPGAPSRRWADLIDDPETTILVAETPVAGTTWLEPRDLTASRMQFVVNSGYEREIGSYHAGGVNLLMADMTVHFIRDNTPTDFVEGMITIDGGEKIAPDVLD